MATAGNKAERLSSVNHTIKTIHQLSLTVSDARVGLQVSSFLSISLLSRQLLKLSIRCRSQECFFEKSFANCQSICGGFSCSKISFFQHILFIVKLSTERH